MLIRGEMNIKDVHVFLNLYILAITQHLLIFEELRFYCVWSAIKNIILYQRKLLLHADLKRDFKRFPVLTYEQLFINIVENLSSFTLCGQYLT